MEIRSLLERQLDALPAAVRTAFVMHDVEEMSLRDSAGGQGIPPSTVRDRVRRGRRLLRERIGDRSVPFG